MKTFIFVAASMAMAIVANQASASIQSQSRFSCKTPPFFRASSSMELSGEVLVRPSSTGELSGKGSVEVKRISKGLRRPTTRTVTVKVTAEKLGNGLMLKGPRGAKLSDAQINLQDSEDRYDSYMEFEGARVPLICGPTR